LISGIRDDLNQPEADLILDKDSRFYILDSYEQAKAELGLVDWRNFITFF
jgi:hypothetical protein